MFKATIKGLLVGIVLIGLSGAAFAQNFVYSNQFVGGTTYCSGDPQFDDWLSFRAGLPAGGVFSITVSGSQDPTGITCSDPAAAQQLANAMRDSVTTSVSCAGNTWEINAGLCLTGCATSENALEISVNSGNCGCSGPYSVRPGIGNSNWGGIAGTSCGAQTQTMTVAVQANAPTIPTASGLVLVLLIGMLAVSGIGILWHK